MKVLCPDPDCGGALIYCANSGLESLTYHCSKCKAKWVAHKEEKEIIDGMPDIIA
jgi:hypothetical protein